MSTTSRITSDQGVVLMQYLARTLFALLAVIYFHNTDQFYFSLPQATPWLLFFAYVGMQLGLLVWRPANGDAFASALDLITLGIVMLLDAGSPPPTMALLFVAVLSNGLLHGLKRFLIMLAGAEVVLAIVLPIRLSYASTPDSSASLFLMAALSICMLYFGLMIWRNQVLARAALEATWRDPDTDFISREALVSTAGWLVPLHDRISSPLTLVLIQHGELPQLSDQVAQRIRRSDVAARYDETQLALLLPCTATAAAEQLLNDLRDRHPGMRAALMTLSDGDVALEQALAHLEQSMARTSEDEGHWLAHAAPIH
ncbi:GGDEF domain-containing protein [Alcanivorax sp. S6407]|uniref:GGDEF domain-containing protein n=1 Tax=Alcanivorax sp. S6407 TaxID=2926424 RepID=UPI001FF6E884|nr:GGDEF domain-containing protein [Alcanivorax sp. S6407]MCK0155119.1 GGDEF domain-containing protein [Alcanivorax sp. S6407]